MSKTILILGGGIGGLVAANELAHRVGRNHKVILVDRSPKQSLHPGGLTHAGRRARSGASGKFLHIPGEL